MKWVHDGGAGGATQGPNLPQPSIMSFTLCLHCLCLSVSLSPLLLFPAFSPHQNPLSSSRASTKIRHCMIQSRSFPSLSPQPSLGRSPDTFPVVRGPSLWNCTAIEHCVGISTQPLPSRVTQPKPALRLVFLLFSFFELINFCFFL